MTTHLVENGFEIITRSTLSHEARRQILERIADGRLPEATRVAEAHLARQLGVSRTPLHEAMVSLAKDGLVEPLGRKGWRITPLTGREAREIYPVLGTMECLALKTTDTLALGVVAELEDLAARATKETFTPVSRLEIEREWHNVLRSQCPNRTLVQLLEPLTIRASRYEIACVRDRGVPLPSEIAAVVDCLGRGDVSGACRCIEIHWRDRGECVARWTSRRPPESAPDVLLPTSA